MRDETVYVHQAVLSAAELIREALAAGEDAAVVSADNCAMWAAAHLALDTSSEVGAGDTLPQLVEVGGPLAEHEPMLATMEMWMYMLARSRSTDPAAETDQTAIDFELSVNDEGDFGARYAAREMHAAGTRTVLWLDAEKFAEQHPVRGGAMLIKRMTAPLAAAGIRSILCFEGAVNPALPLEISCPSGARPVHLARYGSPLDSTGGERPEESAVEDIKHVMFLVGLVALANGKDATGIIGGPEAKQLRDASAGCARILMQWTKAAVQQAGAGKLEWQDFERNAPPPEQRRALLACAESAEYTARAMFEDRSQH